MRGPVLFLLSSVPRVGDQFRRGHFTSDSHFPLNYCGDTYPARIPHEPAFILQTMSRRYKTILVPVLVFTTFTFYYISQNHYQLKNTLSYATRPLWDKDDGPSNIIPHYFADGMVADENMCKLHNWKLRDNIKNTKVLDAILMSSELDLLEIRLNELDPVVDRFFIIESNATFTGLPKETYFQNNRQRFEKFAKKISYRL